VAASKKKTLRVAVIGLGMGRGHVKGFSEYGKSTVAALCDLDESKLATVGEAFDVPEDARYTDYKALFRDADTLELDAVSIALPNALHAPVAKSAFKAGLHVLCEKPLATTATQGRAMLRAAEKAGRTLMVNLSYRFRPQSQALKRMMDAGEIGEIYFGRTVWHRRRGLPGFGGWFGQKELAGGGPIIDLGVHRLDLAMWLMGNPRPTTVSAGAYGVIGPRLAKQQNKTFDVEDLGAALIRFDNGATLILEASWAGFSEKKEDMVTQLLGTEGGIVQRNVGEGYDFEAKLFTEKNGSLWAAELQQELVPTPSSYREFVDAVLEGREPLATGQHGLDIQLILDGIYRSAQQGREIKLRTK
jgi:predicted dehydrogenase